jgi:putative transposase
MSDQTQTKDWPHAPIHRLGSHGVFMVTGATLYKKHLFKGEERLNLLEGDLLSLSKQYGWQLEAWSAFSNHYHFIGRGAEETQNLGLFLNHLHSETARKLNALDGAEGRQVWFNYWDTQLTFEKSYFARLNYVHQNPVKHNLVLVANQYPWCSAAWFERTATPATVKTIYSFKTEKLKIYDYY